MADLTTTYLGLKLRNPIIAASSGLTDSLEHLKEIEEHGAGAVVLKSIFEEEINAELKKAEAQMSTPATVYPEIYDMFDMTDIEDSLTRYLNLIRDAKKEIKIPIIASINCVSSNEWTVFAKRIENAGADALELNMFILPSDIDRSAEDNEKVYFEVIEKIKKEIKIPVALKISYYFSNLATMVKRISDTGIEGIVMFNRFWSPDIDLENMTIVPSHIFSTPEELTISLRWIAIMANRVDADLCASTGVHDGKGAIKQLLVGAKAVQTASALYKHGIFRIARMVQEVEEWMDQHEYKTIEDFRGKMSQDNAQNPAAYERVQFMKHFSGK